MRAPSKRRLNMNNACLNRTVGGVKPSPYASAEYFVFTPDLYANVLEKCKFFLKPLAV